MRGNDRTHQDGLRIFREHYTTAGPYSVVAGDPVGQLNWNGQQITWNSIPLVWNNP